MARQETIRTLNFENAAWESPTGIDETQPLLGEPKPIGNNAVSYTSITPLQPIQPITRRDILDIIDKAPVTPIQENYRTSQQDASQDCYCSNCGPDVTCADAGTSKSRTNRHLNTVKITPSLPRLRERD